MNRRISVGAFLCSVVLLSFPAMSHATIDLVHELTIKVPGLTGPIEQAKFNDVDGDGFPEVLASDGTDIVLFTSSNVTELSRLSIFDSLLSLIAIDSSRGMDYSYDMLFDDVNRDSLPDIAVVMFPAAGVPNNQQVGAIISFSGSNSFQQPLVWEFKVNDPNSPLSSFHHNSSLRAFKALDMDHDGYNELLFSYDSLSSRVLLNSFLETTTEGTAYLFHSYPDSVQWRVNAALSNLSMAANDPDSLRWYGTSYYTSSTNFGCFCDLRRESTNIVLSDGSSMIINDDNSPIAWCPLEVPIILQWESKLRATGNIVLASSDIETISTVNSGPVCNSTDSLGYDSTVNSLVMHQVDPDGASTLLWSLDITGEDYSNFVYNPDFPGSFFAIYNQRVTQFMGSDGSAYQASGLVPNGILSWEYPYGDDRLRLVALDGDSISFYFLGIPTAVDDADDELLPQAFTLRDPYPNPFNPTSIITFTMPAQGIVKVEVFNLVGQRVAILFDAEAQAGETKVEWNAQSLPSGVYFIRANSSGISKTVKALLLK